MPIREKITMDGPTAQRPRTGVHNSTDHTPGVLNQAYIKDFCVIYKFNSQTAKT